MELHQMGDGGRQPPARPLPAVAGTPDPLPAVAGTPDPLPAVRHP
jgi:hypothetical protein